MVDRALPAAPVIRRPGAGPLEQRLRLSAGLLLFAFALSHFLNHALGNISLAAMQAGQDLRYQVWSSLPGQVLLYGALVVHVGLGLAKLARRRTWRMPAWEAVQIVLGVSILSILIKHIIATRGAMNFFGTNVDYRHELSVLWPGAAFWQSVLLLIVWSHAIVGLHYWLRLKPWFPRMRPWFVLCAIAIPVLALTGWINAARLLEVTDGRYIDFQGDQREVLARWISTGRWGLAAVLAAIVAGMAGRRIADRFAPGFSVNYADGRSVRSRRGPTLLEISRANAVPHVSVCGGRARCSTCRTRILAGGAALDPPRAAERQVLARAGAGDDVRLACQIRPRSDLVVKPLLGGAGKARPLPEADDRYRWGVEQPVTVMFVDLRGFTGLSEARLPYDVVFILNRYLEGAAGAIRASGGFIDKVMGDGIMALFGVDSGRAAGARAALQAVVALEQELARINADLAAQIERPLRIGIGLHSGPAILGRIGLAGDAGAAAHLTALGDTVNVASRLEGTSKEFGGFAVVSQDTLEAAGIAGARLEAASSHAVAVRGRSAALPVWALADAQALAAALADTPVEPQAGGI